MFSGWDEGTAGGDWPQGEQDWSHERKFVLRHFVSTHSGRQATKYLLCDQGLDYGTLASSFNDCKFA